MHPDDLLDAIRREGEAMSETLDGDLSVEVPTCPGWTLATLVNHCGRVQRWGTDVVAARAADRLDFPPRPKEITRAWFDEGVSQLLAVLEEAGPEAECWNFMSQPPQARFWFRRQAHEISIHRWDAQAARQEHRGAPPAPVDTELAIDGIDELLDVILPLGYQGTDLGGTVHLHATDSPHGEWLIRSVDGELLVGHDHQKGDVAVRGTASDLLLWLWGRLPLDHPGLERFGDERLAVRLREVLKAP